MSPQTIPHCLSDVVACLACGTTRIATRTRTSITPTACPRCGYVGWRLADGSGAASGSLATALGRIAAHASA